MYLVGSMSNKQKEEVRIIMLNTKNVIVAIKTLAIGSINTASISAKEVLSEPIKQMVPSIILAHNHPSGDSTPSKADILFTKKLVGYCAMFDIELKDHIVICSGEYTSIRQENSNIFFKEGIHKL